jgi:hypothetical protein
MTPAQQQGESMAREREPLLFSKLALTKFDSAQKVDTDLDLLGKANCY